MTNPNTILVTCRKCSLKHGATVCPTCKVPTPHFAVVKGKSSTTHH